MKKDINNNKVHISNLIFVFVFFLLALIIGKIGYLCLFDMKVNDSTLSAFIEKRNITAKNALTVRLINLIVYDLLILLFMLSHIALLYVLLPNFINELQISSYQFSYTFAKSIPSSISLDLNTLNSLKRLFFTGYFSIFLIKKELFFQIPRKYPGKKRRINIF